VYSGAIGAPSAGPKHYEHFQRLSDVVKSVLAPHLTDQYEADLRFGASQRPMAREERAFFGA